jgi:ADP-heptose:LPS heptosyltransferase
VILLGGKEDRWIANEVLNCYSGRVQNLVGRTSLREALGLIARAHVAGGPDTGLMHIAAAVGTPVVSLWGATSPARTGPYGLGIWFSNAAPHVFLATGGAAPIGHLYMKSIGGDELQAKIATALQRTH